MSDRKLLFEPIARLGQLLQNREISSVELTKLSLEALDTEGRALNAVAELTPELAMAQAERADRELAAGQLRGPLQGIPYGAKDLLATHGIPTRWGSPAHRDQVFEYDAVVIERVREAGAVLVAKLAMVELAGGGGYEYADASLHGPGRNPWNKECWAGGSSSGSGSAVGAGLVPFAIGSETWGSITVPSAFCNVSGLRPTYGRVPRYGAMALSWTMDKLGPMAHSAADCGLVLQAIAGYDPRDPSSGPGAFRFTAEVAAGRRFRLGVLSTDYQEFEAPEAEACFTQALQLLRDQGHTVEAATMPSFPYDQAAGTIVSAEGAASFENLIRSPQLAELRDKGQQAGLMAGLAIPAVDYLRAMQVRTLAAPSAVAIFDQFDALIAPTLLHGAPLISKNIRETWRDKGNGGPGNLLGWPSIAVPMGFDRDEMPLSLEFIGPPDGEAAVLSLAQMYQSISDWHTLRPPH